MCSLNGVGTQIVIPANSPREVFRWFYLHRDSGHYGRNGHFIQPKTVQGLTSVGHTTNNFSFWNQKTVKADVTPDVANNNGIYCYSTKAQALADGNVHSLVLGKLKIWGNCVQHSNGFRAEFAEIVELFPTHSHVPFTETVKKKKVKKTIKVRKVVYVKKTILVDKVVSRKKNKINLGSALKKAQPNLKHVKVTCVSEDKLKSM